jgi:ribose transport system permease protein
MAQPESTVERASPTLPERPGRVGFVRTHAVPFVRDYAVLVTLVIIVIVMALNSPAFLSIRNFRNLIDQNVGVGLIACGMTAVIIAGGFDLSVAAMFGFCGVLSAIIANNVDPAVGILVGVAVGPVAGAINGFLVSVLRLNSFLTTLASSIVIRGVGIGVSGGYLITVTKPEYPVLGRGTFWSITYAGWIFIGLAVVSAIVLHRTQWGRYVYAVGGNEEAARLSGIRVGLVRAETFALTGFMAALAGVLEASKVSSGIPNAGIGIELQSIAAVVLGGTSILGGSGAIWRTIVGVFLLAVINNAFNIMNVAPYLRDVVTGCIIIAAVFVNTIAGRK